MYLNQVQFLVYTELRVSCACPDFAFVLAAWSLIGPLSVGGSEEATKYDGHDVQISLINERARTTTVASKSFGTILEEETAVFH